MLLPSNILDNYIGVNHKRNNHPNYNKTVELAESISVHANGDYSEKLIGERRPSESEEIKKYRKTIFEPITKPVISKVFNALQKIRRSPDFVIMFDENKEDDTARSDEDLESYITEYYPRQTSLVNWFFNIAFMPQLIDANGVILVMPNDIYTPENEYYKPIATVYPSANVIDYKYGVYYLLKSPETVSYKVGKETYNDGFIYYGVTDTHIQRFDQTGGNNQYTEVWAYEHNIGQPPVVTMEGVSIKATENYTLYESRLAPMVPHLNEALREYSDLQAEVVQHVHTTMWAQQGQECKTCKGVGMVVKKGESVPVQCTKCNGEGFYPFNPYSNITIPSPKAGQAPIAPPFAGHIEKNLGIAELQDKRVRQHKIDALSAIQFEHLSETLIDQSGVAKQYDAEGANNTVHAIAEDLVRVLDDIIYFINEERYMTSIPDKKKREEQLPTINVPEKFDLLSERYLVDGITAATQANIDAALINQMQVEFASKRYATNIDIKNRLNLKLSLDPFAGVAEDTILSSVSMGWANKEDAIIHANISKFIDMALEQYPSFVEMTLAEQRDILNGFAKVEITATEININGVGG